MRLVFFDVLATDHNVKELSQIFAFQNLLDTIAIFCRNDT